MGDLVATKIDANTKNAAPGMTLGVPGLTLEVPGEILGGKSGIWGPDLTPFWHQKVMKTMYENDVENIMKKIRQNSCLGFLGKARRAKMWILYSFYYYFVKITFSPDNEKNIKKA